MSQTIAEQYEGQTFNWKEPHPLVKELQDLYSWKELYKTAGAPNRAGVKQCNGRITEIKAELDSRSNNRR
jgi:hypothetical protein